MGLYLLLFPRYMAILSKIANFSHPVYAYFAPPAPLGIGYRRWGSKKTNMMGLPSLADRERSLTISSAVWIQYTTVTDGQTRTCDSKAALTHSVAR